MASQDYSKYGIDYADGLRRFFGDDGLYRHILEIFLDDDTFSRTLAAYNAENRDELFLCAHELKGNTGSAALTGLYKADCVLVEYLRGGGREKAEIDRLFADLQAAYELAIDGVKQILL